MTVSKNEYVIVNLWTSENNKALTGVNCGHASLTVQDGNEETYISLWPGARKSNDVEFFQKAHSMATRKFSNFIERPTSYKQDYEQDCVLEAIHEGRRREIKDISLCDAEETAYRVNIVTGTFVKVLSQPRGLKPQEELWAIKLLPANFRMVLYAIDVEKVLNEFNRLKDPECITGWSMAGSNLFTRNINISGKTSENCASLAYRCLNAGGLFNQISSKLSLQPSSAVAPDDLLRVIVAAKVNELGLYDGNPDDWQVQGVDESPLKSVLQAYNDVGQNANAEEDAFPGLKPSVVGCTLF